MLRSLLLLFACTTGLAHAAGPDGSLDTDFGVSGHHIAAFPTDVYSGGLVAISSNLVIMAGARPNSPANSDILLARFFANTGLPDPAFGGGTGAVATPLPAGLRAPIVHVVTRQPNGIILVAGTVDTGTDVDSAFVCRYFVLGNLDTAFAANGCRTIRTFLPGEETCRARGVAVDEEDRIVVSGYCEGPNAFARPFLARLLPTGAYDVSLFGGVFTPLVTDLGYGTEQYFQSVVVTPAGNLAVAVTARHSAGDTDVGIIQFRPDGTLDTSFAGDGTRMFSFDLGDTPTTRSDFAQDLVQRADGRFVLVARSRFANLDGKITMASVLPDGSLDASFGTGGVAVDDNALALAFSSGNFMYLRNQRAVIDRFGRILVTAFSRHPNGDDDDVVRRYRSNGTPDPRFGTGGTVSIDHQVAVGGPDRTRDDATGIVLAGGRILVSAHVLRPVDTLESMLTYALADGDVFIDSFE